MTKIITEPKNLYGFLATPGVEVMNIAFVSDDVAYISWMYYAEEDVPNLRHTNEVIGTYVTAGARIHHYRYFDRLREMRCIVTRTVSYTFSRGVNPHSSNGGQFPGMTSELRSSESISEFVSGGPKNNAYRLLDTGDGREKAVCKVRGITLNYNTMKMVNFVVIRDMYLGD